LFVATLTVYIYQHYSYHARRVLDGVCEPELAVSGVRERAAARGVDGAAHDCVSVRKWAAAV
jgi:hypothetical protein